MDHKAFLASLSPADKAALTRRSDMDGLVSLAVHFGLILALGTLIATRIPGWWVLLLPQGLLLTFLFTLEHECTHKTPFRSERLNESVGRLTGFLQFLPFERFRYFHLAHHRFTNDPDRDPERASAKPATRAAWIWMVTGVPNWMWLMRQIVISATRRDRAAFIPPRATDRITREAQVHLALYGLATLAMVLVAPWLFWVWIVPSLIGQPFLRVYLLAEHANCAPVADMFVNTRTTLTSRVVRALAWNMPFHAEHHTYPAVPFHQLPALHERMKTHLKETADGYAAFNRDYLARMRSTDQR